MNCLLQRPPEITHRPVETVQTRGVPPLAPTVVRRSPSRSFETRHTNSGTINVSRYPLARSTAAIPPASSRPRFLYEHDGAWMTAAREGKTGGCHRPREVLRLWVGDGNDVEQNPGDASVGPFGPVRRDVEQRRGLVFSRTRTTLGLVSKESQGIGISRRPRRRNLLFLLRVERPARNPACWASTLQRHARFAVAHEEHVPGLSLDTDRLDRAPAGADPSFEIVASPGDPSHGRAPAGTAVSSVLTSAPNGPPNATSDRASTVSLSASSASRMWTRESSSGPEAQRRRRTGPSKRHTVESQTDARRLASVHRLPEDSRAVGRPHLHPSRATPTSATGLGRFTRCSTRSISRPSASRATATRRWGFSSSPKSHSTVQSVPVTVPTGPAVEKDLDRRHSIVGHGDLDRMATESQGQKEGDEVDHAVGRSPTHAGKPSLMIVDSMRLGRNAALPWRSDLR